MPTFESEQKRYDNLQPKCETNYKFHIDNVIHFIVEETKCFESEENEEEFLRRLKKEINDYFGLERKTKWKIL